MAGQPGLQIKCSNAVHAWPARTCSGAVWQRSSKDSTWHSRRSSGSICRAYGSKQPDPVMQGLKELASYLAPTVASLTSTEGITRSSTSTGSSSKLAPGTKPATDDWRSPVYLLILVNTLVYLLSTIVPLGGLQMGLGQQFKWWQLLTSGFVHTSAMHLAETVFMTYTFGRLLERTHGAWGLWAAYVTSMLGANLMAVWMLPVTKASSSLAMSSASAAALGLFVAGLAWPRVARKPLEVMALGPWVLGATCVRYAALSGILVVNGKGVGHMVHVLGAVVGASLVAGVLKLMDLVNAALEEQKREQLRQEAEKQRALRNTNDSQAVADVLGTAAKAASALAKKLL